MSFIDNTFKSLPEQLLGTFGNKELGTYYPKVKDSIQYAEDGVNKVGRIISINTSRGDNPILHTVIVRPQ